jgi:hypothetical protein
MKRKTFTRIDKGGTKRYYSDPEMTIYHREDGPAIEHANGSKYWRLNGKLHREDGPAIEYADGRKEWWKNDKLHREDGPAIELPDGSKYWWLNGDALTEKEFNARMNPVKLTLEQIAVEVLSTSVDKLKK